MGDSCGGDQRCEKEFSSFEGAVAEYAVIAVVMAVGLVYIMHLASRTKKGTPQIKNKHARRRR